MPNPPAGRAIVSFSKGKQRRPQPALALADDNPANADRARPRQCRHAGVHRRYRERRQVDRRRPGRAGTAGTLLAWLRLSRTSPSARRAPMLDILSICGSLRRGSYNAAVERALPALAPQEMRINAAPWLGDIPL